MEEIYLHTKWLKKIPMIKLSIDIPADFYREINKIAAIKEISLGNWVLGELLAAAGANNKEIADAIRERAKEIRERENKHND